MSCRDTTGRCVTELSGYRFETLRNDGEFALYRGKQSGASVLVLAPVAEPPARASLARLEHEYSLAAELEPEWSVRPLSIGLHDGRTALAFEDSGFDPIEGITGRSMELTRFLHIAVGAAVALGHAHRRGFIHKDIKPANLLVDGAGKVRLTGFGIASKLARERPASEPAEVISGTFAYMAPEQTGRMNRSIDARSDLYSLGVTLYELLTGVLPFATSDPAELIHCHIARQPACPTERNSGIPVPVANIVMKLLAKNAEERYQTAAGAEADLRHCLVEWEARGRVDPFPLAAHDASHQLQIPERLFGREPEIELLLGAFNQVVQDGAPRVALVSGYSGIGKSSVVNELHKALGSSHGLFASGKFDQYKRDIPYSTIAAAFRSLVRQLFEKNDVELQEWRCALLEAVGQNGELLVSLIPELEHIIGKQSVVPVVSPQEAQARFQIVFKRFLGVFAKPERPLLLFLDDLQWLDTATLQLIEYLVAEPDLGHILFVGAYRDNEVGPSHPLTRTLDAMRGAGARMHYIAVKPFRSADMAALVAHTLQCERDRTESLSQLVHEKTGGNPFFAIQFLTMLADEGLLAFDHETVAWDWDIEGIKSKGFTENVADLMARKLARLPGGTQKAIKLFACLGNTADDVTLASILREPNDALHAALGEAVRAGLISRSSNSYSFAHDRVREAAYETIPPAERAQMHLDIGRILSSRAAPAEIEEKIFEIADHFNNGASLIHSSEEKTRVAELNLTAGRRAMVSAAYASALAYLDSGRALLAEDSWEWQYRLVFDLELYGSECAFLTGDAKTAQNQLLALTERATNIVDRAAIARVLLPLYLTIGQPFDGIDVALEYLGHVGIKWSRHPTAEAVREEYELLWRQIGSREIEALADLPVMTNPESRATVDVLNDLICPALFCDEKLSCLAVGRIANLSLEHGNTDASCIAYAYLNMAFGTFFGDYESGFRFGKLGFDLLEKRGLTRFKARVLMAFGNLVIPWTKDLRTGQSLVRAGFDTAMEDGDVTHAAFCCNHLITNLIASGEALGEVQREAKEKLDFVRKEKFGFVTDAINGQLALIQVLRGQQLRFESIDGVGFDEGQFERHLEEDPQLAIAACWYWVRKLQARVFFQDSAAAFEAALKAQDLLWTSPSFFEVSVYHVFGAIARAAHYGEMPPAQRTEQFQAIKEHLKHIELWAKNCPVNFGGRAALVAAELARLEGRELDAERLYEKAIQHSHCNHIIHIEAIASELAGRFHMTRGFDTIAYAYLRNARYCYDRWGAHGKVQQLALRYLRLEEEQPVDPPAVTVVAPLGQLDLATVLKMSQTVSGEIDHDRLIEKLMILAVEYAGAGRGLLILQKGDAPRIEAVATTGRDFVTVRLRQSSTMSAELPEFILRYVIRTKDSVILDDASAPNEFSADTYIKNGSVRSILCLPLVEQAKLVGVLYLENNLTPGAFTPSRIAVLKLLASQAAISLESARLNIDLRQAQAELFHAARLATMGELATSIAHEVNQPLMAAVTNAATCLLWLENKPPNLDEARKAAERVIENGHHAGAVVRSVYALAKKSPPEMTKVDINKAIGDVLELLGAELRRNDILVETELDSDLKPIIGDRVQLQQVILNLIMNGIEAMGTIMDRPRTLRITSQTEESDAALIAVEDSGPGLDPANLDRIFDPLFTTKAGGMGMGLSICRSVVEAHRGRLSAAPLQPWGSIFRFTLPAAPDGISIEQSA